MAFRTSNLSLSIVRKVLEHEGCKCIRNNKGHEKWSRSDLLRPITLQNHIDPVPTFIVKQIMRTLDLSNSDMEKILLKI